METKIEYHSRLRVSNGILTGTITAVVNGDLSIMDITASKGDTQVKYNWVLEPKGGYATGMHSMVNWVRDAAAVAITIFIYPNDSDVKTFTVTLDV